MTSKKRALSLPLFVVVVVCVRLFIASFVFVELHLHRTCFDFGAQRKIMQWSNFFLFFLAEWEKLAKHSSFTPPVCIHLIAFQCWIVRSRLIAFHWKLKIRFCSCFLSSLVGLCDVCVVLFYSYFYHFINAKEFVTVLWSTKISHSEFRDWKAKFISSFFSEKLIIA